MTLDGKYMHRRKAVIPKREIKRLYVSYKDLSPINILYDDFFIPVEDEEW